MERVQFQQEQMLAELKDLEQKGLFSQEETKHIIKKRTMYETNLIRRIPKQVDFMRYAAYEMGLEALRVKRVKRLKLPHGGPPSISDYALIRRQFQIFERALKKFPNVLSLWVQYILLAQRYRARALVSRICGRALSLHPNTPCLYVLAARHEVRNNLTPGAGRVLLMRGLRMNEGCVVLWRELVRMECGFVEGLRRRWGVLGIGVDEEREREEKKAAQEEEELMVQGMEEGGEASGKEEREHADPDTNVSDEDTRKEILNGALVKAVISNAAKAQPSYDLFHALHSVLCTYPCPPAYRHSLLDHLHSHLFSFLLSQPFSLPPSQHESFAQSVRLYATRYFVSPTTNGSKSGLGLGLGKGKGLEGEALVEAIRRTNEDLITLTFARKTDETAKLYVEFVREWYEKELDEYLNKYLLASLQNVCAKLSLPSLFKAHLDLLKSASSSDPPSSANLSLLQREYRKKIPALVVSS